MITSTKNKVINPAEKSSLIWRIGIKTGLTTCAALLLYFTTMKMLNLHLVLELRFFNFVILTVGITYGIYRLRQLLGEGEYYLHGLGQGLLISIIAVTSFALLFVGYLLFFDQALMTYIVSTFSPSLPYVNAFSIFVALVMEGMASGAVISFCAMQYFKTVDIKRELRKEFHTH